MQLVNKHVKVFVSYTMRDSYVTTNLLRNIEGCISSHSRAYIDILHNDSVLKQVRVESELMSSDLIILLESESVQESSWVNRELKLASSNGIPVIRIQVTDNPSIESVIDRVNAEILSYKKELTMAIERDKPPRCSFVLKEPSTSLSPLRLAPHC